MQAARHQIVHQVVARRHLGKDVVYQALLSSAVTSVKPKWRSAGRSGILRSSVIGADNSASAKFKLLLQRNRASFCTAASETESRMPELPEVETVRRGLEPVLLGTALPRSSCGAPICAFRCRRISPAAFRPQVVAVGRRAKYLLVELDHGEVLLMHLGMSGRFRIYPAQWARAAAAQAQRKAPTHDHVFPARRRDADRLHRPAALRPDGPVGPSTATQHPLFMGLGIEPLGNGFTPECSPRRFTGRRPRSNRRCSTSAWWPASAISMSARPCTAPASRRSSSRARWRPPGSRQS